MSWGNKFHKVSSMTCILVTVNKYVGLGGEALPGSRPGPDPPSSGHREAQVAPRRTGNRQEGGGGAEERRWHLRREEEKATGSAEKENEVSLGFKIFFI